MEGEKEIRLSIEEFEAALKKAKLITLKEVVYEAHVEPGELVIKVVR
jgi:hypothetical protein